MTATNLKDDETCLITVEPTSTDGGRVLKVLPVAGVYGANAAGKSTLLRSLEFFIDAIVVSHSRVASRTGTPYVPFQLDAASRTAPSRYDADIVIGDVRYHYGFSLNGQYILQEWLYSFDLTASRQVRSVMFARETSSDGDVEISFPGKSLKGENKQIAKLVRPNSLFLSVAAQNAHPQLSPIFDFFERVVRRLDAKMSAASLMSQLSGYFSADAQRKDAAIEFLKAADIGISGISFSKVQRDESEIKLIKDVERLLRDHGKFPDSSDEKGNKELAELMGEKPLVKFLHKGSGGETFPIDLSNESAGTQSLLQLLGPVFVRLSEGGTVLVDELNTALHPLVSRELIKLFQNPITNPGHAQLIFTTHDTNLLTGSLLRRDQIWFAEKDGDGATHIYSLSDIKIRSTDNIERGYLMGRFGAIPFMGCGLEEFSRMLGQNQQKGDVQ
ncbi:AAA family ATPase [Burkholderia vietnamiensis]|uniref:AAA family ATPase n=1 Tax=Burkholderia vietnamiensis TaxID=60552 RepID=UPI001CF1CD0B|nr:ATP-binding protein [Burkholderia vietnamiensis]MCA8267831.1 ATP-binding protein [Burkholderia vietnamiensis]UKV77324.1 ATP-binding protein [Burkholderia vietnamiensis]